MPLMELDPAYPILWRDESTVQLGARPAFCVLTDPPQWQLDLLDALVDGVPAGHLAGVAAALGADPAQATAFISRLTPALREVEVPREVSLVTAERVPHPAVLGAFDALRDLGLAPVRRTARDAASADCPTVLLCGAVVPPHLARAFMRADAMHAPITLDSHRAVVGPLVVPGRTACLACLWQHERDRDDAWPVLATQLVARRGADPPTRSLATLATALLPRVFDGVDDASGRSRSVSVSSDGGRRWRSHRVHEACLCQSPRETETAAERPVPIRATTTPPGRSLLV